MNIKVAVDIPKVKELSKANFRDVFFFMLIGINRTGKTAWARLIAEFWKSQNPGCIVAGYDPQGKMQDIIDENIWSDEDDFFEVCLNFRNCLLIVDEYRDVHEESKTSKSLKRLMRYRAEFNIDIIFICHSPADVLKGLTTFISHYFIFYTQVVQGTFIKSINNYAICQGASNFINRYVTKRTQISGKSYSETFEYPEFPFCLVDNMAGTVEALHIKHAA